MDSNNFIRSQEDEAAIYQRQRTWPNPKKIKVKKREETAKIKTTMKNKKREIGEETQKKLEITKAVAQAWLSRSESSKATAELFEAHRMSQTGAKKPSRFREEAMKKKKNNGGRDDLFATAEGWDFGQSLWDSYEIVTVSKKLELGLAMENLEQFQNRLLRFDDRPKKRESRNSLRRLLFDRVSSRRFHPDDVPT